MLCYKGIIDTLLWFQKAKPVPTSKDQSTQIGVHFEEVAEFVETIGLHGSNDENATGIILLEEALEALQALAKYAKENNVYHVLDSRRVDSLDSLCDQIVTAVGVAHQSGLNIQGALDEVNRSNFSKFQDNGEPLLDINRKIIKGPNYTKPDLSQFV